MDMSGNDECFIVDNNDDGALNTLIGDMTDMEVKNENLLSDETHAYPAPESPINRATAGSTLKEYEDQLTSLRKDNFNLKLRVYFLEERLQNTNIPQSHDELHKRNLELKVKLGSYSRELKEHKSLLRSAAEAMDFTEQTAAKKEADLNKQISELKMELEQAHNANPLGVPSYEDSVALYSEAFNLKKYSQPKIQVNDNTVNQTDATNAEDNAKNDDSNQKEMVENLKQENTKLYQLVQSCLERIRRMDKADQKQKESLQRKEERISVLQKECQQHQSMQASARHHSQSCDDSLECIKIENKYKDMLLNKNKRITELEEELNKVNMVNAHGDGAQNSSVDNKLNIQDMLTKRLRELAYFLDSLLSHRCVISEDKKKKIENLLEASLQLPADLELDPDASRLLESSLLDGSIFNQSINILDLTKILEHHNTFEDSIQQNQTYGQRASILSNKNVKVRSSFGREEELENNRNNERVREILQEKEDAINQLNDAQSKIISLEANWNSAKLDYEVARLADQERVDMLQAEIEKYSEEMRIMKNENMDIIQQLQEENKKVAQEKDIAIQSMMEEIQKEAQKWEDEIMEQKKEIESHKVKMLSQKEELVKRSNELEDKCKDIELQIAKIEQDKLDIMRKEEDLKRREDQIVQYIQDDEVQAVMDGDGVCPSPDQGIDSDRHSSLEIPESYSTQEEILALRSKLKATELKLETALRKLAPLQLNHHKVERAICKQIHKTTAVLREAKRNFNS